MPKICPVIQEEESESKNTTIFAISSGFPIFCSGCLFAAASLFSGDANKAVAKLVSESDGAIALNLIFCSENSAAKLFTKPSTALLLAEIEE